MTPFTSLVPGTANFRDAGVGGVAPCRLFRSDALDRLGVDGRAALVELGVQTIVDLRDDGEIAMMPDDIGGLGLEVRRIPILAGSLESMTAPPTVSELYAGMVTDSAPALADALRAIADARRGAVLVHCTAGKDRTGVVCALALLVAGASVQAIVESYAETEQHLRGPWASAMEARAAQAGFPLTDAIRTMLVASPPEAMVDTLALVLRRHGSIAAFLEAAGLSLVEQEHLRARLV